jgi:PAS domain S-box-containing protein
MANGPHGHFGRTGLRALWRRADAAVPLLVKVVVPTVAIAVLAAAVVGTFLLRDTRRSVNEAYRAQFRVISHVVAGRYREGFDDPVVLNAFLEGLNRSAPLVVRIRLFRSTDGEPEVWADSGPEGAPLPDPAAARTTGAAFADEGLIPVGTPTNPAWLGITVDRGAMSAAVDRAGHDMLVVLAVGAFSAVSTVGGVMYGFVLRRLHRLSRVARRVAEGDFTVRLPESEGRGRDVLYNVAHQFDRMLRVVDSRDGQQASVVEFGQRALFGAEVPVLLEEAVSRVARGLDVELATVLELVDDHFILRATRGRPVGGEGTKVPLDSQAGYTLNSEAPVTLDDLRTEHRFTPSPDLLELGIRSGVSVKIPGPTGPYGVLAAHTSRVRRFTTEDANFLQAMANSLGAALRHRRAQVELAAAEERHRTLVEQIHAVVYVDAIDDMSSTMYVSPAYERLFGYTPEEALADPEQWVKMLHPEDRPRIMALSRETNRTGEPFRAEYRLFARDGRVVWVRDEATMLRDEAGRGVAWQGILMDITERKWAEEALRRVMQQNKQILDSAGEGIFGLDREGRIAFINPAAAASLGWSVGELVGQAGHPILHHTRRDGTAYPPEECPIYAALRDGSTRRVDDEVFWRKDGSSFPVEYTSTPLREEGVLAGAVVTFSDITKRKAAEETQREAYDKEREAVERLQQVDEMKNAFLSAVSHELRTPLSSVLGYALTLKQEELDLPPEERRELLDRLAANAQKLQRLLADLLDVDRLERGIIEPRRHPVDVGALVRQVAEETELPGREVEVRTSSVVIEADGPKIERIVENLLVNAAKHTPPGSPVRVEVSGWEDGAVIVVEDRGGGVPDDLKEAVFQPFERGAGSMGHAPGTGIGLSLVARFAELHGGRAWIEDRPGGGASFRVFLPAVSSPDGQADPKKDRGDHAPSPDGHAAARSA